MCKDCDSRGIRVAVSARDGQGIRKLVPCDCVPTHLWKSLMEKVSRISIRNENTRRLSSYGNV